MRGVSLSFYWFVAWIDAVADCLAQLGSALSRRRQIELIEEPEGFFTVTGTGKSADEPLRFDLGAFQSSERARLLFAGRRVTVALAHSRFVFRPLELPSAATGFLDGVVRSQIDRLTPWSVNEATFGWSGPTRQNSDRIAITVAATARQQMSPLARSILEAGAANVSFLASSADPEHPAIPLLDQHEAGKGASGRIQRWLVAALATALLALVCSIGASVVVGGQYAEALAELRRQNANRRAELMNPAGGKGTVAVRALDRRKVASPSAVMTIEALAKILPNDVYLTELRIEDGKVQISGLARDATTVIPLLEQSGRFTHATFYAPTVRNPDGGDAFHVEGRIEPSFTVMN